VKNGLLGFVGRWPEDVSPAAIGRYLASLEAAAHPSVAPPSGPRRELAPYEASDGALRVLLRGAPRFGGSVAATSAADPAAAVLQAYRERGVGLLHELHGAFALAVIDRHAQSCLLAVDRMGIEQLAYASSTRGLVFASSPGAVAGFPALSTALRPQALFDYLLLHIVPAPETVFTGVQKLRPGTCARYRDGAILIERYWQPPFDEGRAHDVPALERELAASLRQAVESCAPDERTGAFLSGGLDSSSVAGMLARTRADPVSTFSIGFGVEGYDELAYARIASRHFGTRHHEYNVTPDDVVEAFPRIAAAYDEPFGNSSAVPTYFCARLAAQHGITHLLAGDGGDELFGGNERYARQQVFEAYQRIPSWLRRGLIEPLATRFDAERSLPPFRKLRSYVDQARIPMPERLESWNLMYRTDLGQMLEDGFRAVLDTRAPLEAMAEVFQAAPCTSLLNKMLFYDWQYTLADNDLRKVGTMCGLAGVRVSYPMLDPRVIDLSLRVPPQLKMRRLELRSFYRNAMRNFLPPEVLRKQKHGFGLPFGVWLKTHHALADMIYGYLGALRSRRIVRPSFINRLIEEHRAGHPGYFGYAIWDLAMLEAWLQSHAKDFAI
jgi:asparagine synthase (glutamine-hydrolysing)